MIKDSARCSFSGIIAVKIAMTVRFIRPPAWAPPLAMTTYYLTSDRLSQYTSSPFGGLVAQGGDIDSIKNEIF